MSHLNPLLLEDTGDLQPTLTAIERSAGFAPNSLLTMARKPEIVRGFLALFNAVFRESNEVPAELKALVTHVASRASGCRYCWAHTGATSLAQGVSPDRLETVFDFERSRLFTPAERAALRVAAAAGVSPNAVSAADMTELSRYWSDGQVVEVVAAIATFGFLNRWNDTLAPELEPHPLGIGQEHLAKDGWNAGKHAPPG